MSNARTEKSVDAMLEHCARASAGATFANAQRCAAASIRDSLTESKKYGGLIWMLE
jgi:hypothetical protein